MQFNFMQIIDRLNENLPQSTNFAMRMANASRVPADYLALSTLLPMETRPDYHVDGATMTIYPTMLGQVPMDSPYPPFGAMSSSQFFENTTKLGGTMFFSEKAQRQLQAWAEKLISLGVLDNRPLSDIFGTLDIGANGRGDENTVNGRRLNAVLGLGRMMRQSHWDTYEWLAWRGLAKGEINWNFGQIPLVVKYDFLPKNKRPDRMGNDAYQGTNTQFWNDWRWTHTILKDPYWIMNNNTYLSIINNDKNNLVVTLNEGMRREVLYFDNTKVNSVQRDVRDRARFIVYDKSGSLIDARPGTPDSARLTAVPFLKDGEIVAIGMERAPGYELLEGAVSDPDNALRLGYTHIAPSIEGQGRPGIWARIYTPQDRPYHVLAETAVNMLPVILNPKKIGQLYTEVTIQ